jgi:hypothetical protein
MSRVHSHYENLKVARDAPIEVIRAAYRSLSAKYHPDRNPGDPEAARIMTTLNTAYQVLSDPVSRKQHDEWIQRSEEDSAFSRSSTNGRSTGHASNAAPDHFPNTGGPSHSSAVGSGALARAAGWLWITFGAISCVGLILTAAFGPPSHIAVVLISLGLALVFLHLGKQTVLGKASDTLGNGVGSVVFGLFGLVGFVGAGSTPAPVTAEDLMTYSMSGMLLVAGVLALIGRRDYRHWRRVRQSDG